MSDENLLKITLSAAVPLWVMMLRKRPFTEIAAKAPQLAKIVAEKGDVLQYRSNKKGETAAAFNALAEGIASLSFMPGGITIFGMHFEESHPDTKEARC